MRTIILDIETNTKHDNIWCCCTKDIDTGEVNVWTEVESLKGYLRKEDKLVGHNIIGFDAPILNRLWNTKIVLNQLQDTLVMSRLLNPSLEGGHSLDAWGKRLGKYKGSFTNFNDGLSEEMVEYCKQDLEVTEALYKYLTKELSTWDQRCVKLEHEVAAIIGRQERHGFKLDVCKAIGLVTDWKTMLSGIEERLQAVFPPIVTERVSEKTGKRLKDHIEVFNPGSRQQIADRLMTLGWKPKQHTEKGQVKVDETILAGIDLPEARSIAEYLLLQKRVAQVESWLESVSEDGRVHGKVITNGAITGRATHHSPNLAQVPNINSFYGKECRECWIVDDGYKLVGIDLAQLELRCLAHYMQDEEYTKELLSGDIHTKNQQAAGLSTRSQAKTFIFALCYGAGAEKIGSIVGGTKEQGQQLINRFLANTPSLKKLREKVERLSAKGTLPGLDGRLLHIRSQHSALNTLLQSAGALVSKQWMVELEKLARKEKIDYNQVAWVHDELQCEVREEFAERLGQLAVQAARKVTDVFKMRCPMDAEYHIGNNWADSH